MKTLTTMAVVAVAVGFFGFTSSAQAGWRGTEGNGNKISEARPAKDFKRIKLKGSLDVQVTRGAAFSVVVNTDSNLMPLVTTQVEGDTLAIDTKDNTRMRGKNFVAITMPELHGLDIRGSGDGVIDGFSGTDLALSVEGSGDIAFSGSAKGVKVSVAGSGDIELKGGTASALEVEVDGSGDVKAGKLAVHDATVSVNGSGNVDLTVNGGSLSASVNGSGDVTWHGDAKLASAVKHGSGDIAHR